MRRLSRAAGRASRFRSSSPISWTCRSAEFEARIGPPSDWQIEWKYDGIRAQVVRQGGQVWIWSRGEELITERFPEIVALAAHWPDGSIVDGEIVVWRDGAPASFALLQQRIGRKTLTKKILADAPAGFIAYDLLALDGRDLRDQPQAERRDAARAICRRRRCAGCGCRR